MSDFQPQYYGPQRSTLQAWNPIDHLRLLSWVFFAPQRLESYRTRMGENSTKRIGTWLASTLLWLPLMIPLLAVGMKAIPVQDDLIPLWLLIAGIVLGWALTAALGSMEYPMMQGWRQGFGPVLEGTFIIVFGLAFGLAFGVAFITGLDIVEVVSIKDVFSRTGITVLVASFGVAFGIAYIVTDKVAFGGAFMITPVLAMCVTGFIAYGIGFVGPFVATFLTTFGLAFVVSFFVAFLSVSLVINRLERRPHSILARGVRISGLAALIIAHSALIWICLLGGWRILV